MSVWPSGACNHWTPKICLCHRRRASSAHRAPHCASFDSRQNNLFACRFSTRFVCYVMHRNRDRQICSCVRVGCTRPASERQTNAAAFGFMSMSVRHWLLNFWPHVLRPKQLIGSCSRPMSEMFMVIQLNPNSDEGIEINSRIKFQRKPANKNS